MKLTDMTIKAFTETLASDAPAPGGGSVAALCGAQGAALCAMVCRMTTGKAKYKASEPRCRAALKKEEKIKERFIALIDEDTDAYGLVSAAFKLPKETDEEKKLRSAEIQKATIKATEVPFETLTLAGEALALCRSLVGNSNPNTASDLGTAESCIKTAVRGAYLNVTINTPSIKNAEIKEKFEKEAEKILSLAE